jgi:hypothetical protein
MKLEDYKTILYRQERLVSGGNPCSSGCYALMDSRESALAELNQVFAMIAEDYTSRGLKLPADTTEIVNA